MNTFKNKNSFFYIGILVLLFLSLGISSCKKKNDENIDDSKNIYEIPATTGNISDETKELIEKNSLDNNTVDNGNETVVNVSLDQNGTSVTSIYVNDNASDDTENISKDSLADVYDVIKSLQGKPCIDIIKNTIDKYGINGIHKGYIEHSGSHAEYKDLNPTALHMAIGCEYVELITALVSSGADLTIENGYGETPIVKAEQIGNQIVIDLLYDTEKE